MDLFEIFGFENPDEVKRKEAEEKKAAEKAKKEAEKAKKASEKKAATKEPKKVALPLDVIIPYSERIAGFSIEGITEATESDIVKELKGRYPHLINVTSSIKEGVMTVSYQSYSQVAKGTIKCSKLLFGGEEVPFEAEEEEVDCEVLKTAFYGACPDFKGCEISFLASDGVAVPVFKPSAFKDEIKQEKITVLVPGVTSIEVEGKDGKITPPIVKEALGDNYSDLEPCVFRREDKTWRIILMGKSEASSAPVPKKGFDISSGNVKVSLLFTKLDVKPSDFEGKEEVSSEEVCAFLVKSGYPEYDKKRCTIEQVSKDLLVAVVKSSTKGAY